MQALPRCNSEVQECSARHSACLQHYLASFHSLRRCYSLVSNVELTALLL
jgi:hypothetical protein